MGTKSRRHENTPTNNKLGRGDVMAFKAVFAFSRSVGRFIFFFLVIVYINRNSNVFRQLSIELFEK